MFSSKVQNKIITAVSFSMLIGFFASATQTAEAQTSVVRKTNATIRGVVRDQEGNAIANSVVAMFRVGTSQLVKQIHAASDGSFLLKAFPGTYTILAVAEGFPRSTLIPHRQTHSVLN
jgi:Carboxypeptidase regulatory-like domain